MLAGSTATHDTKVSTKLKRLAPHHGWHQPTAHNLDRRKSSCRRGARASALCRAQRCRGQEGRVRGRRTCGASRLQSLMDPLCQSPSLVEESPEVFASDSDWTEWTDSRFEWSEGRPNGSHMYSRPSPEKLERHLASVERRRPTLSSKVMCQLPWRVRDETPGERYESPRRPS